MRSAKKSLFWKLSSKSQPTLDGGVRRVSKRVCVRRVDFTVWKDGRRSGKLQHAGLGLQSRPLFAPDSTSPRWVVEPFMGRPCSRPFASGRRPAGWGLEHGLGAGRPSLDPGNPVPLRTRAQLAAA